MKPSEFWAQIFALPEQARQAETEAADLRSRADALCGWARLAISVHRSAIDAADVGGIEEGKRHLDALPPYPDATKVGSSAEEAAPLPKLAGQIRLLFAAEPEPQTASWIGAHLDVSASLEEIRDALKLLSLVSWRVQREGDSQPVEVWGTYKQLGDALRAHEKAHGFGGDLPMPIDSVATVFGIDVATIGIALREAP